MRVEKDSLKNSIKRISKLYKKNAGFIDSQYVVFEREVINGDNYLVISNSNIETFTVERIKLSPVDCDKNFKDFTFNGTDKIAVYGKLVFSIIDKNENDFTISLDKEKKKMFIVSDGVYSLSYSEGIEHKPSNSNENIIEFTMFGGDFERIFDTVNQFQLPNTETNRNFAGILLTSNIDSETPHIAFRSSDGISIAEVNVNLSIIEHAVNQICNVKFFSKSVSQYIRCYEEDVSIRFIVQKNMVILKDTCYTPEGNIDMSEAHIILTNSISVHYGDIINKVINSKSNKLLGSFTLDVGKFLEIIEQSAYSILGNPKINLHFIDDKLLEVTIAINDYVSRHAIKYSSSVDLSGESMFFIANRLHDCVKNLTNDAVFNLYKNCFYIVDKIPAGDSYATKKYITMSLV